MTTRMKFAVRFVVAAVVFAVLNLLAQAAFDISAWAGASMLMAGAFLGAMVFSWVLEVENG